MENFSPPILNSSSNGTIVSAKGLPLKELLYHFSEENTRRSFDITRDRRRLAHQRGKERSALETLASVGVKKKTLKKELHPKNGKAGYEGANTIVLEAKKARPEEKVHDYNVSLGYSSYLTICNRRDFSILSLVLEALSSFFR